MSSGPRQTEPEGDPRRETLAGLARTLGTRMPPFEGPLVAFRPQGPEGPTFLGGDLHAVHPEAIYPDRSHPRDPSLDGATIVLAGFDGGPLELCAVEGIWCTLAEGELADATPYLSIFDTDGRQRTWLLIPPPRLLVGLGQFWLPSVPPPRHPRSGGFGITGDPPGV